MPRGGAASATRAKTVSCTAPGRADQPSLRLSLLRNGTEPAVSFDTALVRQAANAGLSVGRARLPDALPTRFGRFEVADVETSRGVGAPMRCSGFRLHIAKPDLAIDGFRLRCGWPPGRARRARLPPRSSRSGIGGRRQGVGRFFRGDRPEAGRKVRWHAARARLDARRLARRQRADARAAPPDSPSALKSPFEGSWPNCDSVNVFRWRI